MCKVYNDVGTLPAGTSNLYHSCRLPIHIGHVAYINTLSPQILIMNYITQICEFILAVYNNNIMLIRCAECHTIIPGQFHKIRQFDLLKINSMCVSNVFIIINIISHCLFISIAQKAHLCCGRLRRAINYITAITIFTL